MSTYYYPEGLLRVNFRVLDRLEMELNHKKYFSDTDLYVYLSENGLDAAAWYDKDKDYKKLLRTVRDILEALSNNIDYFRSVETEFATTGAAYQHLERRLQRLQQRIDSIPDEPNTDGKADDFTYLFKD